LFPANAEVPGNLLESILSTQLPLELADALVGGVNSETLQSSVHDYLASLLEVRMGPHWTNARHLPRCFVSL